VKRFLAIVAMLSIMLFSVGTAMAATSAFDNLPGGAGIAYFQASPGGFYTLLNIQNLADNPELGCSAAITVHLTFYDKDSNHLLDFVVPMSARDNWGAAVTGDGTTIKVIPQPGLSFQGYAPPPFWQVALPGIGDGKLQHGYVTAAITKVDCWTPASLYRLPATPTATMPAGNNNGNPLDDTDAGGLNVVLPDLINFRAAILSPQSALGFNANMLQGFLNIPSIREDVSGSFVNSVGVNALCAGNTVDWDNSGTNQVGAVALPDVGGVIIQAPELYVTNNVGASAVITDGCTRAGRHKALGSHNGIYWGRYNVTPGLTDSTLVMVFPANNPLPDNPARAIADGRLTAIIAYDDNQNWVSTPFVTVPEVSLSPLFSATNPPLPGNVSIQHSAFTSGELRISVAAPMFGFVATVVAGVDADLYPLVKERQAVNVVNLGITDGAGVNDVRLVGY